MKIYAALLFAGTANCLRQHPSGVPLTHSTVAQTFRTGAIASSLLEVSSGTSAAAAKAWRSFYRRVHNNTHAIEYSGDLTVGGQSFSVIFDTGSDRLILPGSDCLSAGCESHRRYDAGSSKTASNHSELTPVELAFGAGAVTGFEAEDQVCLGGACANVTFVEALEESDQPFKDSAFDGVLGLSLSLRTADDTSKGTSVLERLAEAGAISHAQFSVFMAKDLAADSSEISFGMADPTRADGPTVWTKLSEPGYWQFSVKQLAIGGKQLDLCETPKVNVTGNVSSFFGKMCCRTLDEFAHEQRCQYTDDHQGWRSRTMDSGTLLAEYADGRVAVQLHDGCVQKVPRTWLSSLASGCRGDGTIQAVLDTGSSLIMGPKPMVDKILSAIGVKENCTSQNVGNMPTLSMSLQDGGAKLQLGPGDYLDVLALADGTFCWPHLLATPATGKGAALVLGMPFLRAYYTTFDAAGKRVGFAPAKKEPRVANLRGKKGSVQTVQLRARRPAEFDTNLAEALRTEHWQG